MADYISQNILCEAYLHADIKYYGEDDVVSLREYLKNFAYDRAKFFLYPDVEVDITFSDGSFKSKLRILGTICGLIVGYPDLRDGIIAIYSDVFRLSEMLVAETRFQTKAGTGKIIRSEARMGVIGKLKRIMDAMSWLRTQNGQVKPSRMCDMIRDLQGDVEQLLEVVNNPDDLVFIKKQLSEEAKALPELIKPYEKVNPTVLEQEFYVNKYHQMNLLLIK